MALYNQIPNHGDTEARRREKEEMCHISPLILGPAMAKKKCVPENDRGNLAHVLCGRKAREKMQLPLSLSSPDKHLANSVCRFGRRNTPDLCVLFSVPPCLRGESLFLYDRSPSGDMCIPRFQHSTIPPFHGTCGPRQLRNGPKTLSRNRNPTLSKHKTGRWFGTKLGTRFTFSCISQFSGNVPPYRAEYGDDSMTSRERLLTTLRGGLPDCVPVAPDFSNMVPAKLTGKPWWDVYLYQDPPI
jgi:hypothetical protein